MIRNDPVLMYGIDDRVDYIHARMAYRKIPKFIIKEILRCDSDCMKEIVMDGGEFCITGIGVFRQSYRPAKEAHDWSPPWTDDDVVYHIPFCDEHNRIIFHTFKSFKDKLKETSMGNPVPHWRGRRRRNLSYVFEGETESIDEDDEPCPEN